MKTNLLAGFILFFISLALNGQQSTGTEIFAKAQQAQSERDFKAANQLFLEFLSMGKPEDPLVEAKATSGLGYSYFFLSEQDSALKYIAAAIGIKKGIVNEKDTFLLRDYAFLGYINRYAKRQPAAAIPFLESERAIIQANRDLVQKQQVFRNAYDLATSYRLIANYEQALNYGFEALETSLEKNGEEHQQTEMCYAVLGNIYNYRNDYQEAESYYSKKIALNLKLNGSESSSLAQDYLNMGNIYARVRDTSRSIEYYQKALDFVEKHQKAQNLLPQLHTSLGAALRDGNRLEEAKKVLDHALSISSSDFRQQTFIYRHLGILYLQEDKPDSALWHFQNALIAKIPDFESQEIAINPLEAQLVDDPLLAQLIGFKAESWLKKHEQTADSEALSKGLECITLVDRLYDFYESKLSSENAQLFFKADNHEIYETALGILFELSQTVEDPSACQAMAWNFMEKNKSTILKGNLLKAKSLDNIGLADSLIRQEQSTVSAISEVERNLKSCEVSDDCTLAEVARLRGTLAELQNQSNEFEAYLKRNFPKYARGMSEEPLSELSELDLNDKQLLVNYFEGAKDIYAIGVSNNNTVFTKIQRSENFSAQLANFQKQVAGVSVQEDGLVAGFDSFQQASHFLFQELLAPFVKTGIQDLIIIPDGMIGAIPFEALISDLYTRDQTNYAALDYLVKQYNICYAYSASLWKGATEETSHSQNVKLAGFGASDTRAGNGLALLKGVEKEIASLAGLPNASTFLNDEATEGKFKTMTSEYGIIHLAMHNINDEVNPLNSKLIFNEGGEGEDGLLHMYELYGLDINARLVVLSACQSGIGKFQKGEGSYNIGRGFIYHGNPDMVISLWKVNDNVSARLMNGFYQSLLDHKPVNEALRQTKLDYLATADELSAHPSNWAAFVPIGNSFRIKAGFFEQKTTLFLLALGLIGLTWLVRSRKRA